MWLIGEEVDSPRWEPGVGHRYGVSKQVQWFNTKFVQCNGPEEALAEGIVPRCAVPASRCRCGQQEELAAERKNAKGQKNEAKEYMSMVMLLFEEGDTDASGDLSYEELFDIICELHRREGVDFTEEQVGMQLDQAYAEFDADDDGAISFDEFLDMFCRSTAFALPSLEKMRPELTRARHPVAARSHVPLIGQTLPYFQRCLQAGRQG